MFGPGPGADLRNDLHGLVDGDREADRGAVLLQVGIAGRLTRGGDADHLAGRVDLRAAGITGLDLGADLKHAGQGLGVTAVVTRGDLRAHLGDRAATSAGVPPLPRALPSTVIESPADTFDELPLVRSEGWRRPRA